MGKKENNETLLELAKEFDRARFTIKSFRRDIAPLEVKRNFLKNKYKTIREKGKLADELERKLSGKFANIKKLEYNLRDMPFDLNIHKTTNKDQTPGIFTSPIYFAVNHKDLSRILTLNVDPGNDSLVKSNYEMLRKRFKQQLSKEYSNNIHKIRKEEKLQNINNSTNIMYQALLVEMNALADKHLSQLLKCRNATSKHTAYLLTNSRFRDADKEAVEGVSSALKGLTDIGYREMDTIMDGGPTLELSSGAGAEVWVTVTVSGKNIMGTVSTSIDSPVGKKKVAWKISMNGTGGYAMTGDLFGMQVPLNKQAKVNRCIEKNCGGSGGGSGCDPLDGDCWTEWLQCNMDCIMNA